MAHMVEGMFYVGEKPWHKLGKELTVAPTIKEGIIYAGLDWEAHLQDLFLADGTNVETNKAVVRQSDQSILGVVGDRNEYCRTRMRLNGSSLSLILAL